MLGGLSTASEVSRLPASRLRAMPNARWTTRRWLGASLVLVGALLVACQGSNERSAVGVIIDVQATSLTQIESFTLRDDGGATLVFQVAPEAAQDPQEGLFPGHLRTHALAVEQVTVFYQEEGGVLLALRLEHP